MCYSIENKENGFTLIELLIAMTIGLIILAALSSTFLMQRKAYDVQEQIVEMVQNARAAMDMMTREIRMAGYDPTGAVFDGIPYNVDPSTIDVYADLNDIPGIDNPTGSCEHITYSYDGANNQIDRNTNTGGGNKPFAENIQGVSFDYLEADGVTKVTTTADNDKIRQIKITIIARTTKQDPDYTDPTYGDHYRRYTLTSAITPRNLDL